jgi:hypothetical protein
MKNNAFVRRNNLKRENILAISMKFVTSHLYVSVLFIKEEVITKIGYSHLKILFIRTTGPKEFESSNVSVADF